VLERFVLTCDQPFLGEVDLAVIVDEIPDDYRMNGLFFSGYVDLLGEQWDSLVPELRAPPKGGRYHAFESYPTCDYLRIFDRVARARFPGSSRQAYRLLARSEVEVFTDSTLGKVTFSMLRDPSSALLRYPEVFGVLAHGPAVSAQRDPAPGNAVVVAFPRYLGSVEHLLGVLEGLVMAFDAIPTLEVDREPGGSCVVRVRWVTDAPVVSSRRG
jgi:hypothetical protein